MLAFKPTRRAIESFMTHKVIKFIKFFLALFSGYKVLSIIHDRPVIIMAVWRKNMQYKIIIYAAYMIVKWVQKSDKFHVIKVHGLRI